MADVSLLVLAVSLLLQIGAAAMALRLTRITGWRAAWLLLASAIALMAVRRAIALFGEIGGSTTPDLNAELVALAISVLMVLGVACLAPLIQSIRRAEQEVRDLVEAAPEAMVIADGGDRIVHANARAGHLFGYFPYQLKGKQTKILIPDRFRVRHAERRARFETNPRRVQFPLDSGLMGRHSDGSEFPVQISVSPLEGARGSLVVASIRDMTEEVAAARALRESEGRYRSLLDDVLDKSSVAVCILDPDFRMVWVNRTFESYLGQERKEIVGLDGPTVVNERLRHVLEKPEDCCPKILATYEDNTYTEHFECHVLAGEGRWERWLEHWSQPIEAGLYQGGRIEQYADVTERHNAEQRIRQFVDIARNMKVGLLVYRMDDPDDDHSLRVRILNAEGERILGVSEDDVAGRSIDEAFPKLRDDDIPKLFADLLRTGGSREVKNYEYGDDRVERGGWSFKAFALPDQCVGVLFERP